MSLENTHLFREIHEQPDVVTRFLSQEQANVSRLAAALRDRDIGQVIIAARGTSDNAGRYAQYVLGARNRLPVALTTPSLFTIYEQPPRLGSALVLGISQSGKSPDIVSVLREGQAQGALTAAITNTPDSDLAKVADFVIPLHAGVEQAVAATKTYTAELAAIALLSVLLANDQTALADLSRMPVAMARTLAMNETVAAAAPRYRYMARLVVIGRGFNYATAFETALKMTELTYTIVQPFSSADFFHGPLALIEPGFPVLVLAPTGRMLPEMRNTIALLKERQAELLVISDDQAALALARTSLALSQTVPEWLSPLTTIIGSQLLAMHLAHTRDFDVDSPRGILKVTETH